MCVFVCCKCVNMNTHLLLNVLKCFSIFSDVQSNTFCNLLQKASILYNEQPACVFLVFTARM